MQTRQLDLCESVSNGDGSTGLSPLVMWKMCKSMERHWYAVWEWTIYTSLKSGSYSIVAIEENYASNQERELVIGIAVGETISGMDFKWFQMRVLSQVL